MRIGIVGFAHNHICGLMDRGFSQLEGVEVVAISDDDAYLRERAAMYGLPVYADYREMIERERVDAVAVAAAHAQKGRAEIWAAEQGKHIIADKPAVTSLEDLRALSAALKRSGVVFTCLLTERLQPWAVHLKRLLGEGALGHAAVYQASKPHTWNVKAKLWGEQRPPWMSDPEQYGGLLPDLAIHDADLVLWFSGSRAVEVYGCLLRNRFERPGLADSATATVRLADSAVAQLAVDWLAPEPGPGFYSFMVLGTEGAAMVDWHDASTLHLVTRSGGYQPISGRAGEPDVLTLARDFVAAIREGRPALIPANEVLAAHEVVIQAQRSAECGEPIRLG
jgi:predicted dehydrogenase